MKKDVSVDVRIILKCILQKHVVRDWTFNQLPQDRVQWRTFEYCNKLSGSIRGGDF
jgi:hypothetical protein